MLLPKSSCIFLQCFKSVSPRVYLAKVAFLPFLGLHENRMGGVIYMFLKHSADYIDSKYIWVHGSNSLDSSIFC